MPRFTSQNIENLVPVYKYSSFLDLAQGVRAYAEAQKFEKNDEMENAEESYMKCDTYLHKFYNRWASALDPYRKDPILPSNFQQMKEDGKKTVTEKRNTQIRESFESSAGARSKLSSSQEVAHRYMATKMTDSSQSGDGS